MSSNILAGEIRSDLAAQIPVIMRTREYRLYSRQGVRFLDLWQMGGFRILGHRASGTGKRFKNALEKGLTAYLPSGEDKKLVKAVNMLIPGHRQVHIFQDSLHLSAFLQENYPNGSSNPVQDPFIEEADPGGAVLWRPWGDHPVYRQAAVVLPLVPVITPSAPAVCCVRSEKTALAVHGLPAPAGLADYTRSVYDILADQRKPADLVRQFKEQAGSDFCSSWEFMGIYMISKCGGTDYADLFKKSLVKGVLLPPGERIPAILPGFWNKSELSKLR